MQFGGGLGGSVVGGLYQQGNGAGSMPAAAAPAPTAGPTGRPSLVAAAFGVTDDGASPAGNIAGLVAAGSWLALIGIWWLLPR